MIKFSESINSMIDVHTEEDAINFVYNNRRALQRIEYLISFLYAPQDMVDNNNPYESVLSYLRYQESLVRQ